MPNLHDETWRKLIGTRIATELIQQAKLHRQSRLNERLVRKTQDGTLGHATSEPEDGEEEMHVQVGDNVYQSPPSAGAKGAIKTALIGAALTAAGVGWLVPFGMQLLDQPKPDAPAVANPEPGPDRDTQYMLEFVEK